MEYSFLSDDHHCRTSSRHFSILRGSVLFLMIFAIVAVENVSIRTDREIDCLEGLVESTRQVSSLGSGMHPKPLNP